MSKLTYNQAESELLKVFTGPQVEYIKGRGLSRNDSYTTIREIDVYSGLYEASFTNCKPKYHFYDICDALYPGKPHEFNILSVLNDLNNYNSQHKPAEEKITERETMRKLTWLRNRLDEWVDDRYDCVERRQISAKIKELAELIVKATDDSLIPF